ncbi:MAG TPA: hypothetical protein VF600_17975 [Abditibacteriaceae bacterium]|jgi:hypothetical protein
MIDEPTVIPVSPGAAITRLSQVAGALRKNSEIAAALPAETATLLRSRRDALLQALENDEPGAVEAALRDAQKTLRQIYETVSQPGLWTPEQAPSVFAALHFPDPLVRGVQPVDASRVIATFACPRNQVLTTLSFEDAPGSIAYWLREIRTIEATGEILDDAMVENYAPVFHRLRIAPGVRRFRIESRDASNIAVSDEFEITVPHSL